MQSFDPGLLGSLLRAKLAVSNLKIWDTITTRTKRRLASCILKAAEFQSTAFPGCLQTPLCSLVSSASPLWCMETREMMQTSPCACYLLCRQEKSFLFLRESCVFSQYPQWTCYLARSVKINPRTDKAVRVLIADIVYLKNKERTLHFPQDQE